MSARRRRRRRRDQSRQPHHHEAPAPSAVTVIIPAAGHEQAADGESSDRAVDQPAAPSPSRTDLGHIRQAASQRWPVSEERRREVAAEVSAMAINPNASDRTKLAAARTLAVMDRLNQSQEIIDERQPEVHRIEVTAPALEDAAVRLAEWRRQQQQAIGEFLATLHSPSGAVIAQLPMPGPPTLPPPPAINVD